MSNETETGTSSPFSVNANVNGKAAVPTAEPDGSHNKTSGHTEGKCDRSNLGGGSEAAKTMTMTTTTTTAGEGAAHYYYPTSLSTCDQTSSSMNTGTASETITPLSGDSHRTSPAVPVVESSKNNRTRRPEEERKSGNAGGFSESDCSATHTTPIQEPPNKLMHHEAPEARLTHLTDVSACPNANGGSPRNGATGGSRGGERVPSRQRKLPTDQRIRRGSLVRMSRSTSGGGGGGQAGRHRGIGDAGGTVAARGIMGFSAATVASVVGVAGHSSVVSSAVSLGAARRERLSRRGVKGGRPKPLRNGLRPQRPSELKDGHHYPLDHQQQRRRRRREPDDDDDDDDDSDDWEDAKVWNEGLYDCRTAGEEDGERQENEEEVVVEGRLNKDGQELPGTAQEEEEEEETLEAAVPSLSANAEPPLQQGRSAATQAEPSATAVDAASEKHEGVDGGEEGEGEAREGSQRQRTTTTTTTGHVPAAPVEERPLAIPLTESSFARVGISRFVTMLHARSKTEPIPRSDFHSHCLPPMSVKLYVERLERYCKCSGEAFLCGLLLMLRYAIFSGHPITVYNAHRLLITSTVLGIKMRDDLYYNNVYYARIGGITPREMNKLEAVFLTKLDWNTSICPVEYAQLRDILAKLTENVREEKGLLSRFAQQHPEEVAAFDLAAEGEGEGNGDGDGASPEQQQRPPMSAEERQLATVEGAYWKHYWNSVVEPWLAELKDRCYSHAQSQAALESKAWQEEQEKWNDYRRQDEEDQQSSRGSSGWMSPTSASNVQTGFLDSSSYGQHNRVTSLEGSHASVSVFGASHPSGSYTNASLGIGNGNGSIGNAMGGSSTRYANFVSYSNTSLLMNNSNGGGFPTIRDATGSAAAAAKHSHHRHHSSSSRSHSYHQHGGAGFHAAQVLCCTNELCSPNYGGLATSYSSEGGHPAVLQSQPHRGRESGNSLASPGPSGGIDGGTATRNGHPSATTRPESGFGIGDRVREHHEGNKTVTTASSGVSHFPSSPPSTIATTATVAAAPTQRGSTPGSKLNVDAQPYQYVSRRQRQQQQQQQQQQPVVTVGGGDRNSFSPMQSSVEARTASHLSPDSASTTAPARPSALLSEETHQHRTGPHEATEYPLNPMAFHTNGSRGGNVSAHVRFTNWRSSRVRAGEVGGAGPGASA